MRKKVLEKKLARLMAKKSALAERCKASADVAEVRALTEQLDDLNAEIEETQEELSAIEEEERSASQSQTTEERCAEPPASAELRGGGITASFKQTGTQTESRDTGNPLESMEYRQAFMHYFQRGIQIPTELRQKVENYMQTLPREMRAGDAITTDSMGVAIPITIVREVINTVRKRYGNLYNRVKKLSVPGAVEFPIGELEAEFHWITESTVSPEQDLDKLGTVSFKYHTAEIRIAQTFLSALLSIDAFEAKVVDVIALAYLKAMDTGIVRGTGNGQMLGILNDPRITGVQSNIITMTAAQINNWTAWRKQFFGKLPIGYRSGEFIFNNATVDAYLETMADSNNNPIFRQATGLEVNDGDAADPNGRFFGRRISLVEPDILPDFDTAQQGDIIGIYWQPEEYAINENFGFMMRRWFDDDRNKWINKALTVVDGKVLNPTGYRLIAKG